MFAKVIMPPWMWAGCADLQCQGWKAGRVKTGDNQGPQVVWESPKGQRTVRGVYANSGHEI